MSAAGRGAVLVFVLMAVSVPGLATARQISESLKLVQQGQDDLKWCGSAPLYTFLKAVPAARGKLNRYEQWNIDEQSVVSFAGMAFRN